MSRLRDILSGREANYLLPFYWQQGDRLVHNAHWNDIQNEIQLDDLFRD